MSAVKYIQFAISSIKNYNLNALEKVLNILPLNSLKDQSDTLLALFLSTCASYDRKEAVKIILSAWKSTYPTDTVNFRSRLFVTKEINLPTLAYVTLIDPYFTYIELMNDLSSLDSSPEVVSACGKADKIFGPQSYETYKMISDHSSTVGNWRVEEYAIDNMIKKAPYQPIPKWVKDYTDKPLVSADQLYIPETGKIVFDLPSNEEAVQLLTVGLSEMGLVSENVDATKIYLTNLLNTSSEEEKYKLLEPVLENQLQLELGSDVYLSQVFGPANPLVDQDLTLPGKSNMYGGCRMFLCDVFDYNDEYKFVEDWFTGSCDTCQLRIRQRHHAVRKPRPTGGWINCYCSWDCARKSIFVDGKDELTMEADVLTHELIDVFEIEINKTGIQDRL